MFRFRVLGFVFRLRLCFSIFGLGFGFRLGLAMSNLWVACGPVKRFVWPSFGFRCNLHADNRSLF